MFLKFEDKIFKNKIGCKNKFYIGKKANFAKKI